MGNVRDTIIRCLESSYNDQGGESNFISQTEIMSSNMQFTQNIEADLHTTSNMQIPLGPNNSQLINTSAGLNTLSIDKARFLTSVALYPGDFSGHSYDRRTKQKPTGNDIKNVNTAVSEILKCNSVPDPSEDPFAYLWIVNTFYTQK